MKKRIWLRLKSGRAASFTAKDWSHRNSDSYFANKEISKWYSHLSNEGGRIEVIGHYRSGNDFLQVLGLGYSKSDFVLFKSGNDLWLTLSSYPCVAYQVIEAEKGYGYDLVWISKRHDY